MKHQRLIFWSITAALAGFLFGFDTIVISGAEQKIQDLWKLSGSVHGLAISMALWGTVIGAIFGGIPTAKYGRKKTLIWVGLLYFVSAVGSGLAPDVISFMIARFIGGLGVGASTVAAPMFISEISPSSSRGRLAGMFQFNIVFGILIAFVSNYFFGKYMNEAIAWRWMLGIEAIPAAIYSIMSFTLPESPRWLITHAKQRDAGAKIFRQINPEFGDEEIEALVTKVEATSCDTDKTGKFWSSRLRVPIMLAFLIALFNQFSGINIILYFAPRILGLAGLENALAAAAALGVTNLIFTFVGLWLIDRIGRRSLLYIGSVGYILSLGICAFAFLSTPGFNVVSTAGDLVSSSKTVITMNEGKSFITDADKAEALDDFAVAKTALIEASTTEGYQGAAIIIPDSASPAEVQKIAEEGKGAASETLGIMSMIVLVCLVGFIAAHAVGQGTVIWVFIAEIFPNDHRAAGQALGSSTFFCFMMVLQLVWVKVMVPETKGISLEEMQKKLGIE